MIKDEIKNLNEIASQNEDRKNENLEGWLKSLWRIKISISSYQKMPADKKVFRYKYQIIDTVASINSDFIRCKNNNAFSIELSVFLLSYLLSFLLYQRPSRDTSVKNVFYLLIEVF